MSVVKFSPGKILVIWRGTRRSKWNSTELLADENYQDAVRKFLRKPSFKALGKLMNTPNFESRRGQGFKDEIYQAYFFVLYLVFALEENVNVKEDFE